MFKEFLKKIFNYNKISSITSINDLVHFPSRSELTFTQKKKVDEYKKEYLNALKAKVISSVEIDKPAINESLDFYVNLLLNIMEQEEDKAIYLDDINKKESKQIANLINLSKLRLYFYRIDTLEEEVTLRGIALLEIIKDGFIIFPFKRRSVLEEINHLAFQKLSIKNQIMAIHHETEKYFTIGELAINNSFNSEVKEKYNQLCKIFEVLKLDKRNYPEVNISNIVLMEEQIEIYVSYHKDEIEYLKEKLSVLKTSCCHLSLSILQELSEIEFIYKIFNDYGRNMVSKEEMEDFYRFKFEVLTSDIENNMDFSITDDLNYFELEVYIKIIEEKIEALVMGTNPNLNNIKDYQKELLPVIIEILKDGKNEFLPWDILNNRRRLALILAFSKPNSLEWFFNILDYFYSNSYDMINPYSPFMQWDSTLPLKTLYWILDYNIRTNDYYKDDDSKTERLYLSLYKLYQKEYLENNPAERGNFRFPEGLLVLRFHDGYNRIAFCLKSDMMGKNIYTPYSLKHFEIPMPKKVRSIYLNEGLEEIHYFDSFKNTQAKYLYLPKTLQEWRGFYNYDEHFSIIYIYKSHLCWDWILEGKRPCIIIDMEEPSVFVPKNYKYAVGDMELFRNNNVYINYNQDEKNMRKLLDKILHMIDNGETKNTRCKPLMDKTSRHIKLTHTLEDMEEAYLISVRDYFKGSHDTLQLKREMK